MPCGSMAHIPLFPAFPINHEQCVAFGEVTYFIGPDGATHFRCPCVAFHENQILLQRYYTTLPSYPQPYPQPYPQTYPQPYPQTYPQHTSPSLSSIDHTSPSLPPIDHTSPSLPPIDHTSPTLHSTDHISLTLPSTDHISLTLPSIDHTSPSLPSTDHTSPTLPSIDHTSPSLPSTVENIELPGKVRIRNRKKKRYVEPKEEAKEETKVEETKVETKEEVKEEVKEEETKVETKEEETKQEARVEAKVETKDNNTSSGKKSYKKTVKKTIRKNKKDKQSRESKRLEEENILDALIQENKINKRLSELNEEVSDLCSACNGALFIMKYLLSHYTSRCFVEALYKSVQIFLRLDGYEFIELNTVSVDEKWTMASMTELYRRIELEASKFDIFMSRALFTDLHNMSIFKTCLEYSRKVMFHCDIIIKSVHKFIKDGVSMEVIPYMMRTIYTSKNCEDDILNTLGDKYPDDAFTILKDIPWPKTEEIVRYDDIYVMSGCSWGTLACRDVCNGCGMTKGNRIISSCCFSRQIVCRCVTDMKANTVACQNISKDCYQTLMDSKGLILTQPRCKLQREEIRLGLVLRHKGKTPVPHIYCDDD